MPPSRIAACGSYLPERTFTNADLTEIVDTTDEWIRQRTGIEERRIAADHEATSDMALAAGQAALDNAGLSADALDMVIVATTSPDRTFPATAATVQAGLGMSAGAAFDVQAVCSGFVYGLSVADSLIRAGRAERILLVGAEKFTNLLDWSDRTTCVLFGDGAGAVVLEPASAEPEASAVLDVHLYSDGHHRELLATDGGPGTDQRVGHVRMNGREVFRHAVARMSQAGHRILADNGYSTDDVAWVVPHQANIRILTATAEKLGVPMERLVNTVSQHGNTSAASVPLALDQAISDGRIRRGDLLLLEAMGGGLTWGAGLVRF